MKYLLLTLVLINAAWASDYKMTEQECSPTDIRDHHPELRAHFSEPQDQDSLGWCYGYSAADLLSAEAGTPVSAVHVSLIFNKKVAESPAWSLAYGVRDLFKKPKFESVHEGGWVGSALKAVMKNKTVCSDKNLPYYTQYGSDIHAIISVAEYLRKLNKNKEITDTQSCTLLGNTLTFTSFNNLSEERNKIIASLMRDELNIAMEKLVKENCKNNNVTLQNKKITKLLPPMMGNNEDYENELRSYKQRVNEILSKGKPLSMSYNVKYVTTKKELHASTVVARRWQNGRCEFKIRNSWGRSCEIYKSDIECNKDEGSYWVNDELFFTMANDLTFIDG